MHEPSRPPARPARTRTCERPRPRLSNCRERHLFQRAFAMTEHHRHPLSTYQPAWAAAAVFCLLLASPVLSATNNKGKPAPAPARVEEFNLPGCTVTPEDTDKENQTRAVAQFGFRKGR